MYDSMIQQEVAFFDMNTTNAVIDNKNKIINKNKSAATTPSYPPRGSTGLLTAKLTIEANSIQDLKTALGSIIENITTVIVGFIIAFLNSWKFSLFLVIMIPFLLVGYPSSIKC
jgi:ABC-type multidrug transport system fused ATPase/permease subunit